MSVTAHQIVRSFPHEDQKSWKGPFPSTLLSSARRGGTIGWQGGVLCAPCPKPPDTSSTRVRSVYGGNRKKPVPRVSAGSDCTWLGVLLRQTIMTPQGKILLIEVIQCCRERRSARGHVSKWGRSTRQMEGTYVSIREALKDLPYNCLVAKSRGEPTMRGQVKKNPYVIITNEV